MLDNNCVFCKIIRGEIPADKVFDDEYLCVFKDIEPKAKVHLLAVPKTHFRYFEEMGRDDSEIVKYMIMKIPGIAEKNGCTNGYRMITNQGDDACQSVPHLHIHILGGEQLKDF